MTIDVDALIKEYMPFAQSLARQQWRTAPHALELDELIGIAYVGLVSAAKRWPVYCVENEYDPHALQFFKPYIHRRVYGSLIDAIRSSDWATRGLRTRAKALQQAGQDKGLKEKELAERSGLTVQEVRSTLKDLNQRRPMSLEAEELDPVGGAGVESDAFTADVLAVFVGAIRDLEPEQQVVISLYYYNGLQLQEVARTMGISESRVSQLHAKAVLAIHEQLVIAAQHGENT